MTIPALTIPTELASVLDRMAATPAARFWADYPPDDPDDDTDAHGACESLSAATTAACRTAGWPARTIELTPGPSADPLQGAHRITEVDLGTAGTWRVDFTARQFHDLTDEPLPCPMVWAHPGYPDLAGVDLTGTEDHAPGPRMTR